MSKYLVGLQTIQTGATKLGDVVNKFQLGSHLIRRGNAEESQEVKQKKLTRLNTGGAGVDAEDFGGNTMSMMVAGVMETSICLSDFLDSLWMQNAIIAYRSKQESEEDEVFRGAFEISTPKPDAAALNLLLYFHQSELKKMERVVSTVETKLLPGLSEMAIEGIAIVGQILAPDRVKRRVTADRDYLYGKGGYWGVYALKIRFPKSSEFDGYKNGGVCLGIHLDDFSAISFERIVKLLAKTRLIGMHDAERIVFQEKVFEHQENLGGFLKTLVKPEQRALADLVADVITVLNIGTIYDRKLARSRDFWQKVKGTA